MDRMLTGIDRRRSGEHRGGSKLWAWIALITVYIVWGSTTVAIRVGVREVPPLLFSGVRYALAGAILFPFALRSGGSAVREADRMRPRHWLSSAVIGVLLIGIGQGGVSVAEVHLDAGLTAVLMATIAIWMMLFAAIGSRTWPRWWHVLGAAVGLFGVSRLVAGPSLNGELGSVGLAMISAVAWGLGSVLAATIPLPKRALVSAAMQMMVGGAVLTCEAAIGGEFGRIEFDGIGPGSWIAFAWLVIAGSMIAYSAYSYALSHLPMPTVSTYVYVNPLVAVVLGVVMLGEKVGPRELVGSAIIVAAVALTLYRPRDRTRTLPN
jgi:drug/metabolite transporter (DMT)-like permease